MFFETMCSCSASLQLDVEGNEDAAWLLLNRFINAHTTCGFVSPLPDNEFPTKKFNIKAQDN
jgi:hypothetical protein